jgi:flavodoxin
MKNLYLYFSGTGNTKYVVQRFIDLYEENDDYIMQSIEHKNIEYENLISNADTIILSYPIYDSMLPFIMSEFLEKYKQSFSNKDVITLCTQLLFSGDGGGLPYYILKEVGINVARIKCQNKDCGHDYFVPLCCLRFSLCPSCHQKRTLLFGEQIANDVLLVL